jgi:uncharacterized surface anchored protein
LLQGGQVIQSTTTDAFGNYSFNGLGMGAYTVQEVPQIGWTAQGLASFSVTLNACNQNQTGNTFVNVVTVAGVSLTPAASSTYQIPTSLPHTGDSVPGAGRFALILSVLLLVAGMVLRSRR